MAQSNLFEEVAKFRAARRMWAKIVRERFGAENPRSWMLRFHTQTAGVTLTAQQPDNNVVRTTVQALAGILGGTQSLHVNSKDEALALQTEESAELSLRTQQILAHESGVAETVDPLGGSYYVESLTDQPRRCGDAVHRRDRQDGRRRGGRWHRATRTREIHESAFKLQRATEEGKRIVVGVNRYQAPTPPIEKLQRIDPEETRKQVARVKRVREERDGSVAEASLRRLGDVARGEGNTVPAILECVEAYATVGEISDVLRACSASRARFAPF